MKSKSLTLTTDELLEIVLNSPSETEKQDLTDISQFIYALRLEPGKTKVPFSFLYKIYRLWSRHPTRRSKLGQELTKRFKKKRTRYEIFYLIA